MHDSAVRRAVKFIALTLFVLATAWIAVLIFAGGFDIDLLGTRLTTNEPLRPLLIASLSLSIFILAGGIVRGVEGLLAAAQQLRPGTVAGGLAIVTTAVGWVFCTTAASGADSYGYVSQAELWLNGQLRIEQPFTAEVPWSSGSWTFAPLGYRPVDAPGQWAIVPAYSIGLPLLLAAAKLVGGQAAMFAVVPICGGLLVLLTYGLGRRLGAPGAGLIGAWLVATSPVFLFMLMWPMTDVPVATAWAAACYCMLGKSPRSVVAAGLTTALAILIRPNLFFLAGVPGVWYLARRGVPLRRRLSDAVLFALAAAPGFVATAWINQTWYGSPFRSGYGDLVNIFDWSRVGTNSVRYLSWFAGSQSVLPLIGVLALLVPMRQLWPAASDRRAVGLAGLFVILLWTQYFTYLVFDEWWYLRFLIASWPFIMLGFGAAATRLIRVPHPLVRGAVVMTIVSLGVFNVETAAARSAFHVWQGERRYVSIGKLVASRTEPNSVIFSMQHSGSLRYYGGRMSLRFDYLDPDWLDRGVAWLEERGVQSYLLVENWEEGTFRARFAQEQRVTHLDQTPLFIYDGTPKISLYDLTRVRPREADVQVVVDTFIGTRSVPPAPPPTLTFKTR